VPKFRAVLILLIGIRKPAAPPIPVATLSPNVLGSIVAAKSSEIDLPIRPGTPTNDISRAVHAPLPRAASILVSSSSIRSVIQVGSSLPLADCQREPPA